MRNTPLLRTLWTMCHAVLLYHGCISLWLYSSACGGHAEESWSGSWSEGELGKHHDSDLEI